MTEQERAELVAAIVAAQEQLHQCKGLTDEEQRWVRMAIQREAQSIELRKAIIEKSITGLVWLAILGIGSAFMQWATAHGFKP